MFTVHQIEVHMCTPTWCTLNMVQYLAWWWLYESKHVVILTDNKLVVFWLSLLLEFWNQFAINLATKKFPVVEDSNTHYRVHKTWTSFSTLSYTHVLLFFQNEVPIFFVFDEGKKYKLTIVITPATILCLEIGLFNIYSLSFDVM